MKSRLAFLFIVYLFCIQCQGTKKEPIDVTQAIIKIDSCGLSYKEKELQLGTPIEDWIKVLGQPDRKFIAMLEKDKGTYIWDQLGIAVDNFENGDSTVAWVYIFFLNLDSPEAAQQMLNYARSWEKFDEKRYRNGRIPMSDEMISEVKEKYSPKNYIYPFKFYQGVVDLNGFPVKAGMKVEEINSYRTDLPYSGTFGYVDDDIDGVNDSGVTDKTFGGDYRAPGAECKDGRLQYYELTYTATKKLEYLKIGYESKSDFDSRKVAEASFEERKKNGK